MEANEAVISVYDHGFLYGMGLFETFRTYGGRPHLLSRHLRRMMEGCEQLGIRVRMEEREIADWTASLLSSNGLEDGYVRLTVSAGEGELGLPAGDYVQPNRLLLVKPLPQVRDEVHLRGRELMLLSTRRNTPEGSVRFKSLHYMNNIIAKRELNAAVHARSAAESGNASSISGGGPGSAGIEGLMLSEAGWLAEGIVSNIFFVSGNVVRTPSLDTGILPGITRGRVLELAEVAGYRTEEGLYSWDELIQADEIWMTNSIQELVPITTLTHTDGARIVISGGEAGTATRRLLSLYREDAAIEAQ